MGSCPDASMLSPFHRACSAMRTGFVTPCSERSPAAVTLRVFPIAGFAPSSIGVVNANVARTFDLGLALTYFCASWDARHMDDYFLLDRAAVFLRAYQAALPGGDNLQRLSDVELKYMPLMIPAGNIYVLEWALRDFYGGQVNPMEYLSYLNHHLYLMNWFEEPANQDRLQRMLDESVIPA